MYKSIITVTILLFTLYSCQNKPELPVIEIDFNTTISTSIIANGVQWSAYPHADSENAEWGKLMTTEKWERVYKRLDYMRPGIIRVMDQAGWRYFEGIDSKGNPILNFETEEIKSLYNILDYCQGNRIPVIFGEWGAPGFWGEPGQIHRSDDPRWIHMITRYLDFLINHKGYSCIKYYNLVNEPNGYWASTNGDWEQWKNGILILNDSIKSIGLSKKLKIAAPDAVVSYDNPASAYKGLEWVDEAIVQLDSVIGIYDIHAYPDGEFVRNGSFGNYYGSIQEKTKTTGKKLVLGELGLKYSGEMYSENKKLAQADPNAGEYDSNMFVYEYFYGLDMADALIQSMNKGIEGAIAWDLDDAMHTEGDTGDKTKLKRWGMWNSLGTELCNNPEDEKLRPWFYTWSLMSRFFPSGISVVQSKIPSANKLRVVGGISEKNISVAILNNSEETQHIILKGERKQKKDTCSKFVYKEFERKTDQNGFPVPEEEIKINWKKGIKLTIPAKTFILFTTYDNEE